MGSRRRQIFKLLVVCGIIWLTFSKLFDQEADGNGIEFKDYDEFDESTLTFDEVEVEEEHLLEKKSIQHQVASFKAAPSIQLPQKFTESFMEVTKLLQAMKVPQLPNIFNGTALGEMGQAVTMPKVIPPEVQQIYDDGWKKNSFNQYVSDLISVNRSLPDARTDYCTDAASNYSKNLPATSVIIIFHNEAWSTLLRSFHSVLNRSPDHLITEVILVDDFSDLDHLKGPLDDYIKDFPKVKILRAEKREGLTRARIRGTVVAKGPVLTFLDAHIECTEGWLEPLLSRIAENNTNVVCPIIDSINDKTFEYSYRPKDLKELQVGGFTWNLLFTWVPERERKRRKDFSYPLKSPTIAGGLFSIDKAFFVKLGMYDSGFDIWGSENLELSFKTWMCGGTLEIIPCSHVGHISRSTSPYKWRSGVNVLKKNGIRLAKVWMDEYAQFYFRRTGYNDNASEVVDVSDRVKLRNELGCKSFRWYLQKIYPEQYDPKTALAAGQIKSFASNNSFCIAMEEIGKPVGVTYCGVHRDHHFFFITANWEIRRDGICLDYHGNGTVISSSCNDLQGTQLWSFLPETSQIFHNRSAKCASHDMDSKHLVMEDCNKNEARQKWVFADLQTK